MKTINLLIGFICLRLTVSPGHAFAPSVSLERWAFSQDKRQKSQDKS